MENTSNETVPDPSAMPPDLRERWEERAALMEYDGGLSRQEAERLAWNDTLRAIELEGNL